MTRQQLADRLETVSAHYLCGWLVIHVLKCPRRSCQVCAELRRIVEAATQADQQETP